MTKDMFAERGRGLENEFFHRVDQELIRKIRECKSATETRQALAIASGISNHALLDELVSAGVRAETVAAISLVPLIQVAWADGKLDDRERRAVLAAAEEQGMDKDQPAFQLMEHWLEQAPNAELMVAWNDYFQALTQVLSPESLDAFKHDICERVRSVADAAGGIFGLGTVSAEEKRVLNQLRDTLDRS